MQRWEGFSFQYLPNLDITGWKGSRVGNGASGQDAHQGLIRVSCIEDTGLVSKVSGCLSREGYVEFGSVGTVAWFYSLLRSRFHGNPISHFSSPKGPRQPL